MQESEQISKSDSDSKQNDETELDNFEFSLMDSDSDFYNDSNLDWSFLILSRRMEKVLLDDYSELARRRANPKSKFLSRASIDLRASFMPDVRGRISSKDSRGSEKGTKSQGMGHYIVEGVEDWSFNIFQINEYTRGYPILSVTHEIFKRYGLLNRFKIDTQRFEIFVSQVGRHYKRIPFHNSCHATDVLQTVNCIILNTGFTSIMSELEIFAILITALVHDIEHTGTNNNFHKNFGTEMAKLYMVSVLENHHLRVGLGLLWKHDMLSGLSHKEIESFKFMLISMILSTDMTNHFSLINNMKMLLEAPIKCASRIRIWRIMMLILHAADISNPAKPWDIHKLWVALLCEEFFAQGEKEKSLNLPISPSCDKTNANIAAVQIGFIGTFVTDTYDLMDKLLENDINECGGMYTMYKPWVVCMRENCKTWKEQWRFLKYEFINKLFEETADPRKSVAVTTHLPRKKKKKPKGSCCCCNCRDKELSMFNELSSTTV